MRIKHLLALSLSAAAVCACAGPTPRQQAPSVAASRCEDVVAEGLATRDGDAKRIAKEGINQQLADARGDLLALGLKRIRGVSYKTNCRPHTLGLGMVKCTAVAKLCGR